VGGGGGEVWVWGGGGGGGGERGVEVGEDDGSEEEWLYCPPQLVNAPQGNSKRSKNGGLELSGCWALSFVIPFNASDTGAVAT